MTGVLPLARFVRNLKEKLAVTKENSMAFFSSVEFFRYESVMSCR